MCPCCQESMLLKKPCCLPFSAYSRQCTVNLEILARTLFLKKFAYAKLCENKTLAKWQYHSVVY